MVLLTLHCQLSVGLETFYQKNALIINTFCLFYFLICRLTCGKNLLPIVFAKLSICICKIAILLSFDKIIMIIEEYIILPEIRMSIYESNIYSHFIFCANIANSKSQKHFRCSMLFFAYNNPYVYISGVVVAI